MGECLLIKTSGGIDTSNATALASTIISGYTAYVNDEKVTGSMGNRGSVTSSLNPGEIYTVLEGYHDGTGKVSVSSLSSNTPGTAQNTWILSGYNAWVNGIKLTGSMANRGNQSWNLAANGTQIIWSGFYDGTGKVSQSLTTSGGGTWTPTTSNKTLVNASTWVSEAWYVAGASTLVAANIKKGVNIFGVTGTFVGYVSGNLYIIQNGILQYGKFTLDESYRDGNYLGEYVNHSSSYGITSPTTINGALRIYSWINKKGNDYHDDRWRLEFAVPPWNSTKTLSIWYDYSVYVWSDTWGDGTSSIINEIKVYGGIWYNSVSSGLTNGSNLWSTSRRVGINGSSSTTNELTSINGTLNRWCDTRDADFCFYPNSTNTTRYTTYGYVDIKNMWITLE